MSSTRFQRVASLFELTTFANARVLILGLGSGGGAVAQQLCMAGVADFTLVDPDRLEESNVIRHVCGERYLSSRKVDAVEAVLRDRNPRVHVIKRDADLFKIREPEDLVGSASVVALATDNEASRWRVNELCVQLKKPFVVGKVFTRGIGGEVFAYRPGQGGCLACLEEVLQRTTYRRGISEVDHLTPEERKGTYGTSGPVLKDSPGLNVDISFITSFHTRLVLDQLARQVTNPPEYFTPFIAENYFVWGNRPVLPFTSHFQLQKLLLHPQQGCSVCGSTVEAHDD